MFEEKNGPRGRSTVNKGRVVGDEMREVGRTLLVMVSNLNFLYLNFLQLLEFELLQHIYIVDFIQEN